MLGEREGCALQNFQKLLRCHASNLISTRFAFSQRPPIPPERVTMSKKHTYVLGLNTYDHDVSACLLRDGAIALQSPRSGSRGPSTRPASTRK
jgi:hypothetical protein